MIRLATDVGGTFTDLVGYDDQTGEFYTAKSLTTDHDQSEGVIAAITTSEIKDGLRLRDVTFFAHGGTTVINAITERKGAKIALVTTAGFRDILEIGRGNRPDLYNLQFHSPAPFVPRHLRFEVRERVDANGNVVQSLLLDDLRDIIRVCQEEDVDAVAIMFLHSYINPTHELQCSDILADALPFASICPSHQVSRQWREYERSSTTVLNAYVQPIIQHYFERLEDALTRLNLSCPYYAMQSNGGISTFDQVSRSPLTLVESGPAGGVAGAARIGAELGEESVLSLDVGGTTAKCSLIQGGRPTLNAEYRLEHSRIHPGYPLQIPVVDIVEIGSGGGSIAWVDDRGALKVGPQSAGSNPGPACYGRGGVQPTLTDALLTIGIFNPTAFAGGTLQLDMARARTAIEPIARALGLPLIDAALAIVDVAQASKINALKLVTVQRGHDPRDMVMVTSGGAGPALAASLGRELNIKKTVIPPHPGIFSAWGMLAAEPRADFRSTWFTVLDQQAIGEMRNRFSLLEEDAANYFVTDSCAQIQFTCRVEARYKGQEHGVLTAFEGSEDLAAFVEQFHAAHEKAYTFRLPNSFIEITTLHLEAVLRTEVIELPKLTNEGRSLQAAGCGQRQVYLGKERGWIACDVYDRGHLPLFERLQGPVLIEEATATTFVLERQSVEMTDNGILIIQDLEA